MVDDVAVVARPAAARRPRSYQAGTGAGGTALSGAFWGLLVGLVLLLTSNGELDHAREALADTCADVLITDLDRHQEVALRRAVDADDLITR